MDTKHTKPVCVAFCPVVVLYMIYTMTHIHQTKPAVQESKEPVVVLKEREGMDGDGGDDEDQVDDCQPHQQPVERVLPQL